MKKKRLGKEGKMDERIIVPLDGSKVGESALPYVEDLVLKLSPGAKVEVTLLQVLRSEPVAPVSGEGTVTIEYTKNQIEEAKKQATEYLDKTGESLGSKGAKVTARVEMGDAADEIVKAAEEINADLIAMSTHGRSGISRWAFGSVTDKVLRREGRIPIIMVRAPK